MTTKSFSTHYDNLQVARTASDAVIRAAYRSLAQNYHPDRATGDPQAAERAMQIVNAAYQVLSNPESRREHDRWIAEMEEKSRVQAAPEPVQLVPAQSEPGIAFADDASASGKPSTARAGLNRAGIGPLYLAPRQKRSLFGRLFGWLLIACLGASVLPFGAQIVYWVRFKTWVALPARLAFSHDGNLPDSIGRFLPAKSLIPAVSDWLFHPAGMSGAHGIVSSLLDSLNISFFYLVATIVIFTVLQFIKEKVFGR